MDTMLLLPLALVALFGGAFAVNEVTDGELSAAMGFGHHHIHACDGRMANASAPYHAMNATMPRAAGHPAVGMPCPEAAP